MSSPRGSGKPSGQKRASREGEQKTTKDNQRLRQSLDLTEFVKRHAMKEGEKLKAVKYDACELTMLLDRALAILKQQPVLLELDAPITVVGDIHGQYMDLQRILTYAKLPPQTNYLFLGDYIDRGVHSLECICLLLALKIKFPRRLYLLRGNHECAHVNQLYGFYDEVKRRLDGNTRIWMQFQAVFNYLPLAAVISDKILCMHGGLSPYLKHFDDIRRISRPIEITQPGLALDLLWSDPDLNCVGFGLSPRGVSSVFGSNVVRETCQRLGIDLVIRAHQVVEDGYQFFASKKLITVFSAPNYCNEFNNKGAIVCVSKDLQCKFAVFNPTRDSRTAVHMKPTSDYVPLSKILQLL